MLLSNKSLRSTPFLIREIQGRRDGLQAERTELERQSRKTKHTRNGAERNLKHAQNQKEYETAMREIDALQKQITTFETQVIEKMTAGEEVDKELESRADEINTLDAKRAEALAEFDAELKKNTAELADENKKREAVFTTLPQLAAVYNRLAHAAATA